MSPMHKPAKPANLLSIAELLFAQHQTKTTSQITKKSQFSSSLTKHNMGRGNNAWSDLWQLSDGKDSPSSDLSALLHSDALASKGNEIRQQPSYIECLGLYR